MVTHSNGPRVGGAWWAVPPMGLHRVRHDCSDLAAAVNYRGATFALWVPGNPLSILSLGAVILLHFQTLGVISSSFISLGFCLPMPRNLWDLSSTTRVLNPGHWQWKHQVLTAEPPGNSYIFFFLSNIYSFTWLCLVLVPAQGLFSLHCSMWEAGILTVTCSIFSCSMWDLMLRPGNELGPPNWRAPSLTTGVQGCPSHGQTQVSHITSEFLTVWATVALTIRTLVSRVLPLFFVCLCVCLFVCFFFLMLSIFVIAFLPRS